MAFSRPSETFARKAGLWQYLAFVGVLAMTPLLFIGGPGWTDGPLFKSAWNLGHILFFALLTIAVRPWRFHAGMALWGWSTLVVLLLGAGIELLQSGTNRQVDWQDMLRNLTGLWVVLAFGPQAAKAPQSPLGTWSVRIVVALMLVVEAGTTARVAIQQYRVSQWLPALYDFSQPDPSPYWKGPIALSPAKTLSPESVETRSERSLRISLSTSRYSGVSLHNFPHDWRDYSQLLITLYNPGDQPLRMTLRINDIAHDLGDNAYHDRFNTPLILAPGINRFELDLARVRTAPAGRPMDMQKIRRLGLFASELAEPRRVYLYDLRLK